MFQWVPIMNKSNSNLVKSCITSTGCSKSVAIELWKYSKQLLTNKVSLVESDLIEFINNESDENIFNKATHRFNINGTQENTFIQYRPSKIICCKRLFQPCKLHRTKSSNSKVTTIKPN